MLHLFFKKGPYFNGDMDDIYTSWTVGVALTRAIELSVTVLVVGSGPIHEICLITRPFMTSSHINNHNMNLSEAEVGN